MDPAMAAAMSKMWKICPHTLAAKASRGHWIPFPHLRYVSMEIAAAVAKGDARMIIEMPPRHGKSHLISWWTPVWFLEAFKKKRVILATYSDTFARKWGRVVRNEFKSNELLDGKLAKDSHASNEFELTNGGGMTTVGINGGITGKGGDLIIIDDPVKTWKEAMSPTYQDSTRDWFDSVLYTRAEPGASIILLQTRWHKKDLAGYLLTEHEDDWTEINFPAIATSKDALGRNKGDPLCRERYDIRKLEKIKAVLPPRMWNSLYQGTPTDDEGNILKRTYWRTWTILPPFLDEWILSVDMNMKEGINNDFTVIQCWARKGAMYYLVDQIKGQWGITHQVEAFKRMSTKWPDARKKLVENKANGPALQGLLKRAISGIVLVEPDGGKEVRAMAAEPALQSGNVHIPADVGANPWVPEFIEECGTFPTAEHDDQVDAATQAINYFETKSSSDISKLLIM